MNKNIALIIEGYSEVHTLAKKIDFDAARKNCPSFDIFMRDVKKLIYPLS